MTCLMFVTTYHHLTNTYTRSYVLVIYETYQSCISIGKLAMSTRAYDATAIADPLNAML